jgi:putative ABC transport system substrate-binding protein
MNNRRKLVIALGAVAFTPRPALAQLKQAPLVIGWLSPNSRETEQGSLAALKEELAALGWKEGSQVLFEERWADGRSARYQALADELAAKNPALIVALSLPVASAAAKAAPRTAIVLSGADMVAAGLAKSLARPGGMITGVTNMSGAIAEKYLELLLAAAPQLKRVGFLVGGPNTPAYREYMDAARRSVARLAVEGRFADVVNAEDIEPAIARLAKEGAQALVVFSNVGPFALERRRILKLALANRWPVIARSS